MTLKARYLPPLKEIFSYSLRQARRFSTLDAYSEYLHMQIREEARSKTAIVMHSRNYQYIHMRYGDANAPAPF